MSDYLIVGFCGCWMMVSGVLFAWALSRAAALGNEKGDYEL